VGKLLARRRHQRDVPSSGTAVEASAPNQAPRPTHSRTALERQQARERFRAGQGRKPEPTPEFDERVALMAEKLAGTHHNVVR
jgi:hypothetical protein